MQLCKKNKKYVKEIIFAYKAKPNALPLSKFHIKLNCGVQKQFGSKFL